MAEVKQVQKGLEREYVIPLRREWMKVPRYKRTARGVKAVKKFVARHMGIRDRDLNKIKLDVYLNNEIWFRGGKKPPSKIKVKAVKEENIVRVELVEAPERIKFLKARDAKRHKKIVKEKVEEKKESGLEEKIEKADKAEQSSASPSQKVLTSEGEKTEKEKKEETEKEKAVEQANIKIAETAAKAQKHTIKGEGPQIQRKALKK